MNFKLWLKIKEDGDLNAYGPNLSSQSKLIRVKEPPSKKIDKKFGFKHLSKPTTTILVARN